MDNIEIESNYQKKCIYRDLTKEFLKRKFDDNEYLLLDFIDERFPLIKLGNDIIGTYSYEFRNSKISDFVDGIEIVENNYDD